jgi:hypothetical protein
MFAWLRALYKLPNSIRGCAWSCLTTRFELMWRCIDANLIARRGWLGWMTQQASRITSGCRNTWRPRITRTSPKNHQNALFTILHHYNELLIGPPSDFVRSWHRWGISAMRARTSSIVILLHLFCKISFNSFNVCHLRRRARCFKIFQIPSIRFRSGDCGRWIKKSI